MDHRAFTRTSLSQNTSPFVTTVAILAITSLVVGFQQDSGLDFSITSVITTQALLYTLCLGKKTASLEATNLSHFTPVWTEYAVNSLRGTPLATLRQPIKRYHKHLTQTETEET